VGSPAEDFSGLALSEEEIAVSVAGDRVEDRVLWLAFRLEALGFREMAHCLGKVTGLMKSVGEVGTSDKPLERAATAVCVKDRLPGRADGFRYVAERGMEFAQVSVNDGRVPPIL